MKDIVGSDEKLENNELKITENSEIKDDIETKMV